MNNKIHHSGNRVPDRIGQDYINPDSMDKDCNSCLLLIEKIMSAFNLPMEMQAFLKTVCEDICLDMSVKSCQFMIFNNPAMRFENIAASGLSHRFLETFQPVTDDNFLNALKISDIKTDKIIEPVCLGGKKSYDSEGIKFFATIALRRGVQVVGVLNLYDDKELVLNQCEITTLKTIAQFSTNVILTWVFNTTLKEVTRTVHSSLDFDKVLDSVVTVVTDKLRVKGCTIRLLDQNQNTFHLKAAYGLSQDYLNKGPVLAQRSISQVLQGRCVAVFDATNDDRLQYPEAAVKEGIGSILSVPLIIYKNIIGDLRVYTHRPYKFSDNELNLMMAVGEQCALAIRDAKTYTGIKKKYDDLMSDFHQWFDVDA
ncbi:MAG: GAF domain-containing protein [Deltaproteobacteria bacterium]|nr:GAF domain-containing protein [Deltaproteobacteria bacterium]